MLAPRMLASTNRSLCKFGVIAALLLVSDLPVALKAADAPSPWRVSDNGRMLVDATGKPVFLLADTAWSLAFQLGRGRPIAVRLDQVPTGKYFGVVV